MDHSFGYNAQSTEGDFLSREELLWTVADIAAKGGNLLLNVGPRAADATIPDPQRERLGWLADFVPANGAGLFGTRPWTTPGSTTVEGDPLRYTARDAEVFAFVRSTSPTATLADVVASPATSVADVGGRRLSSEPTAAGLRVELPRSSHGEPVVVAISHAAAHGGS